MTDASARMNVHNELAEPALPPKGSPWLRELYEYYAPVRDEILARGISEEELFADIDAAIAELRAEERARAEQAKRENDFPD